MVPSTRVCPRVVRKDRSPGLTPWYTLCKTHGKFCLSLLDSDTLGTYFSTRHWHVGASAENTRSHWREASPRNVFIIPLNSPNSYLLSWEMNEPLLRAITRKTRSVVDVILHCASRHGKEDMRTLASTLDLLNTEKNGLYRASSI